MKRNYAVRRGALDGVEVFLSVARHRSFRRAASELGVTPSAAGQAVRALETRLGVALFVRTTRSVGMTEAGERFLTEAEPAYLALVAAGAAASDLGGRPAGLLRLAVPRSVVPLVIRPILPSFAATYPDIELEIAASEELIDISSQGFDAGMRMGQFIAKDMTALRLTPPFRMIVVGSPEYLDRHGTPLKPEELKHHACLRSRRTQGGSSPWRLVEHGRPLEIVVQGPLIAGDFPTLLDAAIDGVGLAQVPEAVAVAAIRAGTLRPVLAAFASEAPGLFLYYPDRRQVLPKLRAFIEHLKAHMPAAPSLGDELVAFERVSPPQTSGRTAPSPGGRAAPSAASVPPRPSRGR
jgi:DNA-binding transcriptional LysR family regulator